VDTENNSDEVAGGQLARLLVERIGAIGYEGTPAEYQAVAEEAELLAEPENPFDAFALAASFLRAAAEATDNYERHSEVDEACGSLSFLIQKTPEEELEAAAIQDAFCRALGAPLEDVPFPRFRGPNGETS
jgi:hypothetical protein